MQVVNIPNSMTVLPEMLPYSIEMVGPLAWSTQSSITYHDAPVCPVKP